jgi:hypothetical protein
MESRPDVVDADVETTAHWYDALSPAERIAWGREVLAAFGIDPDSLDAE